MCQAKPQDLVIGQLGRGEFQVSSEPGRVRRKGKGGDGGRRRVRAGRAAGVEAPPQTWRASGFGLRWLRQRCSVSPPPPPSCLPTPPSLRPVQSPLPANSNDLLSERESQHSCIWKGKPGQGPDTPHWGPFPDWGTVYLD